jgi:hypothetical protein
MTDDQKRRQRGEVLLSFQEAIDNVAAFRQKISDSRNCLRGIVEWMDKAVDASGKFDPEELVWSRTFARQTYILKEECFREAMNFEDVTKVMDQFSCSLRRVEELRASKIALGL